jgi:heptosyltransferase-2
MELNRMALEEANNFKLKVRCNEPFPIKTVKKILVRGTNWIGDVIMTLPAIRSIRQTFPKAHIAVLVKPWVADIIHACPEVDEVILYRSPGEHEGFAGILKLARELKDRKFDCAILLQNAIEAAIIARLAGIPVRAGYNSDARGWLLTHSVRRTDAIRQVHQTGYYLEMLKSLGFKGDLKDVGLRLGRDTGELMTQLFRRFGLKTNQLLIGMAPGAAYGPAKRWPADRFAEAASQLSEKYSARVILFGSKGDRETTELITHSAGNGILNLAGETSLREAMALISKCALFISNDSGLMHVAGALGVSTIAIFGSTNPVTTSPSGERCVTIRKDLDCSPCLKKKCPTDFRCMTSIEVSEVLRVAQDMMRDGASA